VHAVLLVDSFYIQSTQETLLNDVINVSKSVLHFLLHVVKKKTQTKQYHMSGMLEGRRFAETRLVLISIQALKTETLTLLLTC
jgi:hypothetical protein